MKKALTALCHNLALKTEYIILISDWLLSETVVLFRECYLSYKIAKLTTDITFLEFFFRILASFFKFFFFAKLGL